MVSCQKANKKESRKKEERKNERNGRLEEITKNLKESEKTNKKL